MEGYISIGLLVSLGFMCVYSCARIEFGFLPFISKRIPFQMAFPDSYFFYGMKQKTLFQGFCFPSLKHEGTRRKRFTAWECSGSPWLWVLNHMAVRIFPQWKRLLNLYVYLSSIQVPSPQREEWIAHHIYFLFFSTGKYVSSVVSRALSVFVLNRFSSELRFGQNSVRDILQY